MKFDIVKEGYSKDQVRKFVEGYAQTAKKREEILKNKIESLTQSLTAKESEVAATQAQSAKLAEELKEANVKASQAQEAANASASANAEELEKAQAEIETLKQSVEDKNQEAAEMLQKAQEDSDNIRATATEEAEKIKADAVKEAETEKANVLAEAQRILDDAKQSQASIDEVSKQLDADRADIEKARKEIANDQATLDANKKDMESMQADCAKLIEDTKAQAAAIIDNAQATAGMISTAQEEQATVPDELQDQYSALYDFVVEIKEKLLALQSETSRTYNQVQNKFAAFPDVLSEDGFEEVKDLKPMPGSIKEAKETASKKKEDPAKEVKESEPAKEQEEVIHPGPKMGAVEWPPADGEMPEFEEFSAEEPKAEDMTGNQTAGEIKTTSPANESPAPSVTDKVQQVEEISEDDFAEEELPAENWSPNEKEIELEG